MMYFLIDRSSGLSPLADASGCDVCAYGGDRVQFSCRTFFDFDR